MAHSLHLGDACSVMTTLAPDSVDVIVTDPPYGVGFMGLDWDKALAPDVIWEQCLRVLKPGAFAFIMCLPRQDLQWRMIAKLERVGFIIAFTPVYWTYATGFPKAADMSKLIDKRRGVEREVIAPDPGQAGRRTKNVGLFGGSGDSAEIVEAGRQCFITEPATPEAKQFDGAYAGFQPKPAVEVILVVMKPLSEKTYLDQALYDGKGVTWMKDCGIPIESDDQERRLAKNPHTVHSPNAVYGDLQPPEPWAVSDTRFPANLLVSDDVLNDGRMIQSVGGSGIRSRGSLGDRIYGTYEQVLTTHGCGCGDSGSYSRYFDLDAWARERLPESVMKTWPFLICPKPSKSEKNEGLDQLPDRQMYKCDNSGYSLEIFGTTDGGRQPRKNIHPTCKPVKLMAWLIMLGSREGDMVADPFMGSGSTGVASKATRRQFTGIEIEPDYFDIAKRRIAAQDRQLDMFSPREGNE